jgi:HEAT repeat protein
VTVYAVVGGESVLPTIASMLNDVSPDVAAGAMIGMLRHGGLQAVIDAGQQLMAMISSPRAEERALAARIIGEVGNPGFYHPLLPLLADGDPDVAEAAIRASGAVGNPSLVEPLVAGLSQPRIAGRGSSARAHR